MTSRNQDELLGCGAVAKLADVVPATVVHWAETGKLPVLRTTTGMRLFRRADVEAFLAAREAARLDRE